MEQERKNRTKQLVATYYGNSILKIADGKKDWAYNVAPGLQRAEMLAWELRLPNHQEHDAGGGPLGPLNANGMIIPNRKAQNPAMPFFDFDSGSDPRHKFAGGRKYGMFRGTIAETRYHIAFVPAGATKDENGNHIEEGTVNTILYSKGGSSSLQSLMHVLVIPKRCYKQRVFNAVTLPEDYPFEDAMECGRKAIAFLKSSDVPGSLTYWENKYENKVDLELASLPNQHPPSGMKGMQTETILNTLEYTVHVSPNNSVQSLHIHVYSPLCLTKAYKISEASHWNEGTVKNVPIAYFMPNGCCRQMVNQGIQMVRDSQEFKNILSACYSGRPLHVGAAGTRALNGLTFTPNAIVGMHGWSLSDHDTENLSNPGHNNYITEKEREDNVHMTIIQNEFRLNEKIVNNGMISFQQGSSINGRLLTRVTGIRSDNGRIVENMYRDKKASQEENAMRVKLCSELVQACSNRKKVAALLTDQRWGLHNTAYKGTFAHDVKLLFTLNHLAELVQQGIVVIKQLYRVDETLTLESCLDNAVHMRFEHVIAENKRLEWNRIFNVWLNSGEEVSVQGVVADPGPDNMRGVCQDIDDAMMLLCLKSANEIIISDDYQYNDGGRLKGLRTDFVSEMMHMHNISKTFFSTFYDGPRTRLNNSQ